MHHYYFYAQGIIITQRVCKLMAIAAVILIMALFRGSLTHAVYGVPVMQMVLGITFLLTVFRAHRRSFYEQNARINADWHLIDHGLFFLSLIGFILFAYHHQISAQTCFAYLYLMIVALLAGVALGEGFWHNTHIKHMEAKDKERYWANYKDSLWR